MRNKYDDRMIIPICSQCKYNSEGFQTLFSLSGADLGFVSCSAKES